MICMKNGCLHINDIKGEKVYSVLLSIGLFHFISLQELFQEVFRERLPGAFRKILGYFQGVLLKLSFSKNLEDQASSTYISFFQIVG